MVILSWFWTWVVLIDNVSQKSLEFGSCASKYINANSKVNTALSPRRLGLNLGNNFIMNVVYYSSLKKWVGCSDESLPNSFKPAVLLTKTGFYRGENFWLYLVTASGQNKKRREKVDISTPVVNLCAFSPYTCCTAISDKSVPVPLTIGEMLHHIPRLSGIIQVRE